MLFRSQGEPPSASASTEGWSRIAAISLLLQKRHVRWILVRGAAPSASRKLQRQTPPRTKRGTTRAHGSAHDPGARPRPGFRFAQGGSSASRTVRPARCLLPHRRSPPNGAVGCRYRLPGLARSRQNRTPEPRRYSQIGRASCRERV